MIQSFLTRRPILSLAILLGSLAIWGIVEHGLPPVKTASPSEPSLSEIREKLIGRFDCKTSFLPARTSDDGERLKELAEQHDTVAVQHGA